LFSVPFLIHLIAEFDYDDERTHIKIAHRWRVVI